MPKKNQLNPYIAAIVEFIETHPTAPKKARRLARLMAIGESDYPLFRDALRELKRSGKLSPRKTSEQTTIGRFKANPRGFGFVTPIGPEGGEPVVDIYVPLGRSGGALSGDVVLVELRRRRGRRGGGRQQGRLEGEVIKVLERGLHQAVGTLELVDGGWFLEPDGGLLTTPVIIDGFPEELRPGEGVPPPAGTKVLVEITEYPEGPGMLPVGAVTQVLGQEGTLDAETTAVILAHDLPHRFSEDALREAKRAVESFASIDLDAPELRDGRLDLRDHVIVTIDPEEARDYDDAVSFRRDEAGHAVLGVHIADVSFFVPEGSALDLEARERGTSVYFPRRVVPMLPQGLSQGVCALAPGEPKAAVSVFITYDEHGEVLDRSATRSLITSRQRLTYEEAQRICDGLAEGAAPEVTELLQALDALAHTIRIRRAREGMLDLDLPEVDLVLDAEGRVTDAHPAPDLFTHTLIEMFMVEANEAIASLLAEHGVPAIRRIHPRPSIEGFGLLQRLARTFKRPLPSGPPTRSALQRLVASVRGQPVAYAINLALLRSLQKARYSTEDEEHFALASDAYCHFTSPIRRYPDLVVHRMVARHLLGADGDGASVEGDGGDERDEEALEALEALAEHCSETERRAEAAEQELRQVLLLQHLARKVGERFKGVVTGVTSFGPFIQLPRFLIEGLVPRESLGGWWEVDTGEGVMVDEASGSTLRLGDVVEVVITGVDVARRHLNLAIS